MKLLPASAFILFIALATGCGGGSDLDPETGFTGGKACPQSMINARNDVAYDCRRAASPSTFDTEAEKRNDLIDCRNSIRNFLDKNPNVYCKANNVSQGGIMYVDSEELRTVLNEVDSALAN